MSDTLKEDEQADFRFRKTVKLGTFHIGSSAADLLVTAVWNRIMIVDLGMAAWPVALLSGLRYFLAPLSLWAGHRADTHSIRGSRRLAYIWIGRGLVIVSLPLLPLSTGLIARGAEYGWLLALLAFVMFGSGVLISGPAFLALVHDSAPYDRRGLAISIVHFILVASFAFLPLIFARMMPAFELEAFLQLSLIVAVGAGLIWFFSVWREEGSGEPKQVEGFKEAFKRILSERSTRRYALFLGASAFFVFMQDAVLEPFGGDVFGLPVGETTRFNAFWGSGVLLGMVVTMLFTRRWRPDQQVGTTMWGLGLLALPMIALGGSAWTANLATVRPLLVLFGIGFGIFTAGGVSLLMAMSIEHQAAAYLALWSVIQLVSRGAGIAAGGLLRDAALAVTGSFTSTYGLVFWLEALGALACIWLLRRVDVSGFASKIGRTTAAEPVGVAAD
ncbi:MAG: BCD family MFS transporter [Anaerolineales bacterium]